MFSVEDVVKTSDAYKRLADFVNTPSSSYKGHFCTAIRTTVDVQKIILELLKQNSSQALILSRIKQEILKIILKNLLSYESQAFLI